MNEIEFQEFLKQSDLLDADQTQRLMNHFSNRFYEGKELITNMDAEAISNGFATIEILIKNRTGE